MSVLSEASAGAEFTAARTITESDIARCARLTGDFGAHHISGLAGRPIAQGLLTAAVAPLLRGDPGFQLRTMSMKFLAPVFAGDTVTATVRVTGVEAQAGGGLALSLELSIGNQDGVPVLTATGTGLIVDPTATGERR